MLPARFHQKVRVDPATGCHIWTGARGGNAGAYGSIWWQGRMRPAHRVAFEDAHGPMEPGTEPDHLCEVKLCVNVAHLEAVTHAENIRRSRPATRRRSRTECSNGHPYSPTNTRRSADGRQRICRTCQRTYKQRSSARKREAA